MPAVAAIPALALLAGCALGLLVPDIPPLLEEAVLVAAALVAWRAWERARAAALAGAVVVAFAAGGALLGAQAWREAWRPTLRVVFEELARRERAEAEAAGRWVPEEDGAGTAITGVLRSDAAPSANGASVSMDVLEIETPCPRAVTGGVLLTVVGEDARQRAAEWRAGRVVHVAVRLRRAARYLDPGVPDAERALARRGTTLVGTVKSAALVEVVARGSPVEEGAAAVRAFVRRAVAQAVGRWDPQAAAIVTAIVIGDRAGLDDSVQQRLQEAGTYHVLAISGGNIAILAGLALLAFRLGGVLGRSAMLVAIAGLVAYAYLVGGGASVDRATLVAVVYFAGRAIDHRGAPFNTLAVVASLLVVTSPLTIADPAFALTFGATAAILAAAPLAAGTSGTWATRGLRSATALLVASAASEVALLPVSAFVFSRVTFAGLVLNFAAIPLMAVAQIAGMALVPVALASSRAAAALGCVAWVGAEGLVRSADLVRLAPWVTWRVSPPGWRALALYYSCLVLAWLLWRGRWWRAARHVALAGTAVAAVWILLEPWSFVASRGDGRLRVTFVDVGQGDSAVIQFPRGGAMVVDAGGLPGSAFDIGDRVVAPVLRGAGIHRLQSLVLTHGDNDHIGGALSLVTEFKPIDVWEGIPVPSSGPLRAVQTTAAGVHARWTNVQTADRMTIDGVGLLVRHPDLPDWERQRVRNDDSVVIELLWRDVSIVLTGDIGADAERDVAAHLEPALLRVVKVPHHGSATSSTQLFIDALKPRVAVVSVGRSNSFGHPAAAVIDRYRAAGAEIFRTDQDGAIQLDTDGSTLVVKTFTGRQATFHPTLAYHEVTKGTK